MKVNAAVFRDKSGKASVETLDLEEPRDDEILVRVVATGVCHTDIKVSTTEGMSPRPIVLGHEGAGIVERVGARVAKVKPGDSVVMTYDACEVCPSCLANQRTYCDEVGPRSFGGNRPDGTSALSQDGRKVHGSFFGQSSFADFALCYERNIVKVRKDAPLELLGPLACGVQTGAGAAINALKIGVGQSFAVFGTGSVGLSAIMAARLLGAGRIIAVDVQPARLQMARALGATDTVDAKAQDALQAIRTLSRRGVDFALDTTGVASVIVQAVKSLAPLGTCGFVASPAEPVGIYIRDLMLGGRKLKGIVEGESIPDLFIPTLVDFYLAGRFPIDRLATYYPFERINDAIHDSETGRAIKPILRMAD
jgi:aryl-alcohol dehydrogenase